MDPFVEYSHHVACGMEPGMQNSSASIVLDKSNISTHYFLSLIHI